MMARGTKQEVRSSTGPLRGAADIVCVGPAPHEYCIAPHYNHKMQRKSPLNGVTWLAALGTAVVVTVRVTHRILQSVFRTRVTEI